MKSARIYDETAVYYSVNGYSLWINYLGGTYRFTDYDTQLAEPAIHTVSGATEEVIRGALEKYNTQLPADIAFSEDKMEKSEVSMEIFYSVNLTKILLQSQKQMLIK